MSSPVSPSILLPARGRQRAWWRAPGGGSAFAHSVLAAARAHPAPVLLVASDHHRAHQLASDLAVLGADAPELPVLALPDWETLPYDRFSPHPDIVSERLGTLARLPTLARGIVVVAASTLCQRLAPPAHVAGGAFDYRRGARLVLDDERSRLDGAGYRLVPQVLDPGDFAVRGGLLDVYPMGADTPYRIELFDEAIETIRAFDPETQRSRESLDAVRLLPGREIPLDEAHLKRVLATLRERFDIDTRRSPLYQDLKAGHAPPGIEYYLPLFFEHTHVLFDYLHAHALPVLDAGALEAADAFWQQVQARYEQHRHDIEQPLLPPEELFLPAQALRERLNQRPRVELCEPAHPRHLEAAALDASAAPTVAVDRRADTPCAGIAERLAMPGQRVLIAAESPGRREALLELLHASQLHPQTVASWAAFVGDDTTGGPRFGIGVVPLGDGLVLADPTRAGGTLLVLTERELFPERAAQSRRRRARDPDTLIRDLGELADGAPIVHESHGVGRYRGLVTLEASGLPGEFLDIEYAKGDRLYVPVTQLHLISRYSGASDESAPLHALGSEQWQKARRRALEKVRDVAAELLDIQARRQARPGTPLQPDRALYEAFASAFPFEETPDQQTTIEAVRRDLAATTPMDRVVCGDVGFGKTEVALRAAFLAASAGKQVAVLVPTTLLAAQHERSFRDRFADWPLRVEGLSRFKSPRETQAALARVAVGGVDIVIGTHRLLQKDVRFKDLGLVIVDEEQRFGVRHKEALKALRANVHLLTLTATPIPRTLNMAMSGLRDLSLIATPPAQRMAVQTFVTPWDDALLAEAFQRELGRGGQVYFLHNEVDTIERMRETLQALVPDARIGVAHGQMPERELERVMLDFHKQRHTVLLCTTIIESGIDIPNANTMIIHRADRFGLAQLHQLRGRVGRSHHRAYAYLLTPERRAMTGDAEKRLQAIAAMGELGAGFLLATHDLEIRGAGELLGEEQSGQITEVGFSLYTELLARAVRAIRAGKVPELDAGPTGAEVELHLPALLPDDYLGDVHTRLTFYKRISAATDAGLDALQEDLVDRFGPLPVPARTLFMQARLRLAANALGLKRLDLGPAGGRVDFGPTPNVDAQAILQLIQKQPQHYRLDGPDRLRIKLELADPSLRLDAARGLLATLAPR
jgi:transcription-repair coupling factor (superfamily II helicase)